MKIVPHSNHLRSASQFGGKEQGYSLSNSAVKYNEWHHIVFTWDNSTKQQRFYVDGALVLIDTYQVVSAVANSALYIGDHTDSTKSTYYALGGKMKQIRLYDNVISPEVISSISAAAAYVYDGCYADTSGKTLFHGKKFESAMLTPEQCYATCLSFYSSYFALIGGNTCQCSNGTTESIPKTATSSSNCVEQCYGDGDYTCGGESGSSVYSVYQINTLCHNYYWRDYIFNATENTIDVANSAKMLDYI
ncbi:hypothetical protein RFI_17327 [Reticulomyxa filosa]|uniref:WSC domain-containing protein n=1 Tax=Reticulomyxa filosa TaxID=46433 RepID=X6N3N3_RETFI|nr:hypothetical protein RFI_17327 [Reticulomyxa filosa]|eukprot:ETO19897.1 hypothetical protein RFI_17327 [Reticulomyxa filosa]